MKTGLRGDEGALIAAAVAGKALEDIALAADVSVSTVQRRLRDPEIVAAIREGRADHQRQAVGQLNADLTEAITRLRELVGHEDPSIALAGDRQVDRPRTPLQPRPRHGRAGPAGHRPGRCGMSRARRSSPKPDATHSAYLRAIHRTNVTGLATREDYEIAFAAVGREIREEMCGQVVFALALREAGVPIAGIIEVGTYPPNVELPPEVREHLETIAEVVDATGTQVLEMREQGGPEADRFTTAARQEYGSWMVAFGDIDGTTSERTGLDPGRRWLESLRRRPGAGHTSRLVTRRLRAPACRHRRSPPGSGLRGDRPPHRWPCGSPYRRCGRRSLGSPTPRWLTSSPAKSRAQRSNPVRSGHALRATSGFGRIHFHRCAAPW